MATPKAPVTRAQFALVSTAALSFSFLWAMACNLVIEFLQTGGNAETLIETTIGDKLPLFVLGSTLIWTVGLGIWALSGRLWVACAVLASVTVPLAYANYLKVNLRLEPLYPSDLAFAGQASFLEDMVGTSAILQVLSVAALLVLVLFLCARVLRRTWRRTDRQVHPRRWRVVVAARVMVLVVAGTVLYSAANFNEAGNPVRATYEASGAHWQFWFQKLNYRSNGFVAGMLYNLDVPAMSKPTGYSRSTMDSVVDRYSTSAADLNAGRESGALEDTNIVLVLSEAFSDPTELDGVTYDEDPIPRTRALMDRTTSGSMLAQLFGGGTANMEFEVLTGMSLSQFTPQMQTPYQMLVPSYSDFPSAVGLLARDGHRPIAVHPYMTSMYKREQVYPILGFQEFLGEDEIDDPQRLDKSTFISDASAFGQVTSEINASDDPLLVNLVTMQNHYPMKHLYTDPMYVTGLDGDAQDEASGYGRGLKYTDAALQDFLSELESADEETAVVFYGDHQPAFWPEDVREENGDIAMRSTPFFLWSTEGLDKQATAALTSPIYFLPMLYDAMGAELPPYYALLLELQQEIPAMEQGLYLDETGEPMAEDDLSARARQLLRDYRMVQYDLSVGARYSQDELFYPSDVTSAASD